MAANEIRYLLKNPATGMEALSVCNQAKTIFEGRNQKNTAVIRQISLQCDEAIDVTLVTPDDQHDALLAYFYWTRRGKLDGVVYDLRRVGKWDTSVWDPQLDGTFPLKGIHPDGQLVPSSLVPRCGTGKPLPDLKCG